jgi:hypothetical protein
MIRALVLSVAGSLAATILMASPAMSGICFDCPGKFGVGPVAPADPAPEPAAPDAAGPSGLAATVTPVGKTHLLAVGICPPYRHDIPVEVCRNAVKAVVKEVGEALTIPKDNVVALVDEQATGPGFLAALADLGKRLTADDRLVLYLNAHGDSFGLWADYYGAPGPIAAVNAQYDREDYVLVFWTKEDPAVPALSLMQKEWLTVEEVVDAIEALPAKVALILESCSSGKTFAGFHIAARDSERIDYMLLSAGPEQISNLNSGLTIPLFTEAFTQALDLPMVDTFGEAVGHARMTTVLHATALCATMTVPQKSFSLIFPGMKVPNVTTHGGDVSPPLWMCAQVPSVADFTGVMSGTKLYQGD